MWEMRSGEDRSSRPSLAFLLGDDVGTGFGGKQARVALGFKQVEHSEKIALDVGSLKADR